MNKKLVSIITPSFNCSDTLQETAASILNQSHQYWEWLITDDCSDNETQEVLKILTQSDERIKVFFSTENGGAAVARNNSISHAKGDFVAFLDSDDLWCSDKLKKQIEFMGDCINFSFTAYEIIDDEGRMMGKRVDANQFGAFSYDDMLKKRATLGCSTVMLRQNAFGDISMPLLRTGQDYALWLKLLKLGESAYVLPSTLTKYRIMPNSISRNKLKKARRQWQIYREYEKLSIAKSLESFCFYAWRAIFRR